MLTEHEKSILNARGCEIRDHRYGGEGYRLLVNTNQGADVTSYDLHAIRRACRTALASAGHDVSDLRIGIFGPFPGY